MRILRLGLLILAIIAGCVVVVVALLTTLADEPDEITVHLTLSSPVASTGETFALTVTVENADSEPVLLTGITLDDDLLAGMTVTNIDPATRNPIERSYPLIGDWVAYPLDWQIMDRESLEVRFTLRATTPGHYSGDVGAWIEDDLLGINTARARFAPLEFEIEDTD